MAKRQQTLNSKAEPSESAWWQSCYKAMNASQLIIEMRRITNDPSFCMDRRKRLIYLSDELLIKERAEF